MLIQNLKYYTDTKIYLFLSVCFRVLHSMCMLQEVTMVGEDFSLKREPEPSPDPKVNPFLPAMYVSGVIDMALIMLFDFDQLLVSCS